MAVTDNQEKFLKMQTVASNICQANFIKHHRAPKKEMFYAVKYFLLLGHAIVLYVPHKVNAFQVALKSE